MCYIGFTGRRIKIGNYCSRLKVKMRSVAAAAAVIFCVLTLQVRSLADTIVAGDIYVYIAPGIYIDITAALHEDPIYCLNGQNVLVVPDFLNDVVYDGNGNVIGFVGALL